jgi:hypothetical protein
VLIVAVGVDCIITNGLPLVVALPRLASDPNLFDGLRPHNGIPTEDESVEVVAEDQYSGKLPSEWSGVTKALVGSS